MSKYLELMSKVKELTKEAEQVRREEYAQVVRSLRKTIVEFNIPAKDLGYAEPQGLTAKAKGKKRRIKVKATRSKAPKIPVRAKYGDASGNTWSGRGKTPRWMSEALANGATKESFLVAAQ